MPITSYSYTKTPVDVLRLEQEIRESSIVIALDHVEYSDPNLVIYFKDALSTVDNQTLDSIVAAHTGEPLDLSQPDKVIIEEHFQKSNVLGRYQATTISIDIPSAQGIYTKDISWPIDIALYSASIVPDLSMSGDIIDFDVAPDTVIGAITSPTTAGDNYIVVDNSVISNLKYGYFVKISDGANVEDLGVVKSISGSNVFTENLVQGSFAAGSYVLMTIKFAHKLELFGDKRLDLGTTKIGGSVIPAGTVLRLVYNNVSGTAKKAVALLEYTY